MTNKKLYLIPTTPTYEYEPYDHIYLINASSPQEAYQYAKSKLDSNIPQELLEYESYNCNVDSYLLPHYPFHESKKYDILNSIFLNTKGFEYMAYFQVNWNNYTEKLSKLATYESWSNDTYPNNGILANYIVKTYEKLTSEKGIIIGQGYALFNTGLFTKYYEPIYVYQTGSEISFYTAYELSRIGIKERPERANYFENPELLLFDWHYPHYPIDVYYKHILDDERNKSRFPKEFLKRISK